MECRIIRATCGCSGNSRPSSLRLYERLLGLRNDVGLLSEEYDPSSGRLVGNFPQAFSHVGLVNSAFNLARAEASDASGHGHGV